MNVNADTISIALHFLLNLQLHARNQLRRTRKVVLSVLSWIFRITWAIPTDGEDVVIASTSRW